MITSQFYARLDALKLIQNTTHDILALQPHLNSFTEDNLAMANKLSAQAMLEMSSILRETNFEDIHEDED